MSHTPMTTARNGSIMPDVKDEIDLSVDIAGVKLASPLMTAGGTCGYADEYIAAEDFERASVKVNPAP